MRDKVVINVDERNEKRANKVISELAHNKLTLSEVDNLKRYVSGIMLTSPKETRIMSTYNLLEIYPTTKGKLTETEKENIIMCIWSCIYIKFEDGTKGIDNLESIEDVKYIRDQYYDSLFGFKSSEEDQLELSGEFGYDETNPIQVSCIDAIDEYFSRLRTIDNRSTYWDRVGSCGSGVFKGPTDQYEIVINSNKLFGKKEKRTLYINMYNKTNSTIAPEGFKLVDQNEV